MKEIKLIGFGGIGIEARAIALITMLPYHYPPPSVPRLDHIITKDNLGIEIILIDRHPEMDVLILSKIREVDTSFALVGMDREKDQNALFLKRDYRHLFITAPAVIEEFIVDLKKCVDVCIVESIQSEHSQVSCTNCHPWQFVADRSQHPP